MSDTRALDAAIEDLPTARALITTLQDQLLKAQRENASLRHQLDVLCRRLFGKKSEKVDPHQLTLALEQLANEPGAASDPIEMDSGETTVRARPRRRPARPAAAAGASAAAALRDRGAGAREGVWLWSGEDADRRGRVGKA